MIRKGFSMIICPHCAKKVDVASAERGLIEKIRMFVCPFCRKVFRISHKSK
jgi:uncharacterized protein YbaR (Trm112 family)